MQIIGRLARSLRSALPMSVRRRALVVVRRRRWPRFRDPRRFTDKVHWRVIHDRRALLARTCDKLAMKEIARETVGDAVRVPQTLWSGTDLSELADVTLPERWVLKPAHRFGLVVLGAGRPDVADLQDRTAGWLEDVNGAVKGEWAYTQAVPRFLVEEWIGDPGQVPADYKCFVFDGVAQYVLVVDDRFGAGDGLDTASYYDRDWNRVAVRPGSEAVPLHPRPDNLDELLEVAGRIGAPFDFMRIDLYNVDGVIWFGETTPYPVGGMSIYSPASFDLELGRFWTLPRL